MNALSVAAKKGPKAKPPLKRDKEGNRKPTKGGVKLKERWHERTRNGEVTLGGIKGGQAGPVNPDTGLYPIKWPHRGGIHPPMVVKPKTAHPTGPRRTGGPARSPQPRRTGAGNPLRELATTKRRAR